jgi:Tfp pilus assembly protein PilN
LASYTSGNSYFWFGVGLGIAIIIISAVLSSYQANLEDRLADLDGQLAQTEQQRNKEHEKVLMDTKKQATVLKSLLASKLYWSQALDRIDRMMQGSVRLTSIDAVSQDGTIKFQGVAGSFAAVARQVKAFTEGAGVTDAIIGNVTGNSDGTVKFDGEMTIDTRSVLNKNPTPTPKP